jgi:hypothetical protein
MASDWNLFMERLLSLRLTASEHRLAPCLGRCLLGFNRRAGALGRARLREMSGLDGRDFERARKGLAEKGLVRYESEGPGRGKRTWYELLLDPPEDDLEKAALYRPIVEAKKAGLHRPNTESVKGRSQAGKRPVYTGHVGINVRGKQPGLNNQELVAHVIDAYRSHGGSLELHGHRGILARHAATLAGKGIPEPLLVAAAAQLGRDGDFVGNFTKLVKQYEMEGPPCIWLGGRKGLSVEQLTSCGCRSCLEWVEHVQGDGLPEPIREEASGTEAGEQTGAVEEIPERPVGEVSPMENALALIAALERLER